MLERLLSEIHAGGTLETRDLAARLGTTPQMVEAMLEYLQRSDLIEGYANCDDGCLGCSLQEGCKKPQAGALRLWQSRSGN